jgi:hypothetical protein
MVTGIFMSLSLEASAVAQREPPTIRMPGFPVVRRPRMRASGARVKPCRKIVAVTTAKVKATMRWPSAMPDPASSVPNRLATATATMPRGAIQAVRSRSCQVRPVAIVAMNIAAGRMTNSSATTKPAARQSRVWITGHSSAAVSSTNRPETSRMVTVSLKRRSSASEASRELAMRIPMIVTASRPDSSSKYVCGSKHGEHGGKENRGFQIFRYVTANEGPDQQLRDAEPRYQREAEGCDDAHHQVLGVMAAADDEEGLEGDHRKQRADRIVDDRFPAQQRCRAGFQPGGAQ